MFKTDPSLAITWSAARARATPPAPALPSIAETTTLSQVNIDSTRSSIALMFFHASSSGDLEASITFKSIPLEKKSGAPSRTILLMFL